MWPNPQETAALVTFTEEILNGKLHFLCTDLKKLQILIQSNIISRLNCTYFANFPIKTPSYGLKSLRAAVKPSTLKIFKN